MTTSLGSVTAASPAPDEIATVIHVLEEFRRLDPDMPIQYALSFLTIARHEGLSMGELAQRLGIAQSSASRNIAALSKWHSFGKEGHDLVEAREDPRERRRKIVSLTGQGRRLVDVLRAIVAHAPVVYQTEAYDPIDPTTPAPDSGNRGEPPSGRRRTRRQFIAGEALALSTLRGG